MPDECHSGNARFPSSLRWIATPTYLIAGDSAGHPVNGMNTTGIRLIERATGIERSLGNTDCTHTPELFGSIPSLPLLSGCASQTYCYASIFHLAYEPVSKHLLVHYNYAVGPASGPKLWDGITAYDLRPATGGRAWSKALQSGSPPGPVGRRASVAATGALPNAFLVQGEFPIDANIESDADISRTLLLDALTGTIRQRWDGGGEQDPSTGDEIGPADGCLLGRPNPQTTLGVFPSGLFGWLDGTTLCRYRLVNDVFAAVTVGTFPIAFGADIRPPTTFYKAPNGDQFLLGSNAAIDLTHSVLAAWDPDPAVTTTNASAPSVAAAGGTVVVGGDFTFVRGRPSPGIAALDSAMAPIASFTSPLRKPTNNEGVNALALSDGRLIVGGAFLLPGDVGSAVAVDTVTGALDPWTPDDSAPIIVDDIAVAPGGDFWLSGFSDIDTPTDALQHYAAIDAGGALLKAPDFGCLDAPVLPEFGPPEPICTPEWARRTRVRALHLGSDGSLYVAGVFGTIDGTARRGLARIAPNGSLSPWDPDLLGALSLGPGQGLMEMESHSIVVLGDRVILGGVFRYVTLKPDGGGGTTESLSPMFVFSASTATLQLPTSADRTTWFPLERPHIYDIVHTDTGLFVAMGDEGMGIVDATTLALDEAASAPSSARSGGTASVETRSMCSRCRPRRAHRRRRTPRARRRPQRRPARSSWQGPCLAGGTAWPATSCAPPSHRMSPARRPPPRSWGFGLVWRCRAAACRSGSG